MLLFFSFLSFPLFPFLFIFCAFTNMTALFLVISNATLRSVFSLPRGSRKQPSFNSRMDFHESQNERYGSDSTYRVGVDVGVGVDVDVAVGVGVGGYASAHRKATSLVNAAHEIVRFKFLREPRTRSLLFPTYVTLGSPSLRNKSTERRVNRLLLRVPTLNDRRSIYKRYNSRVAPIKISNTTFAFGHILA